MNERLSTIAIWLLTVAAYLARPWSCMAALQLEVTPPGDPYHSIDPHGFGVLGAMVIALLMMAPVLWLLLQRRPPDVAPRVRMGRTTAVMLVIATPMVLQITYLNMPLEWCWPVIATSAVWAGVVLTLCLRTAPGSLSVHAAFDRFPRTAWTFVTMIGVGKVAIIALAIA
ncbi:hypothetical protein [Sphingomonas faeni]|uniref:hypothetical protein n=1 Tax=Sphingomonas faeni TaxID=185950 RepID=UPI00334B6993